MRRQEIMNKLSTVALALIVSLALIGCDGNPAAVEDLTPPSIAVTSPDANSTVAQDTIVIRGTATDDVGVARLTYTHNGAEEQEVPISPGRWVDFEFTVPALEPGSNHLIISAFDAAGNTAETQRHVNYAAVAAGRYQVVVVGEFGDGGSHPRAINAPGDVALQWERLADRASAKGFVWSDGALTELVLPDGHILMNLSGINASRVVVGDLEEVGTGTYGFRDVPVVWEDGQPHVLSRPSGFTQGGGSAINDAGAIAGYVMDDEWDNWAAVLWHDGEPTLIRADAGASDINSSGVVTGSFWSGDHARAFRWDDGQMTTLEPPAGMNVSHGLAINDAGDVVGFSYDRSTFPRTRATLWQGTAAVSLGEVPGGMYYRTWGVNNHLQAVGGVDGQEPGSRQAFISENGRMSLLNHLTNGEWDIIEAMGINDAGQILALAVRAGTQPYAHEMRSVILDPVDAAAGDASFIPLTERPIRGEADPAMLELMRPRSALERFRGGRGPR
jgi:probable HAF family extracellular repeat protein